ncbi:MAG: BamA/TamA family outer membrane protein [Sediminibacterium sp.]
MKCRAGFLVLTFILAVGCVQGQTDSHVRRIEISPKEREEKDLFDLFRKKKRLVSDSLKSSKPKRLLVSVLPAAGYTLQTGFAGLITGNIGFFAKNVADPKMSVISSSVTYSQYNQIIIPLYADILSRNGNWEFVSDNRYMSYPSSIFGLGGPTDPNKNHTINFEQIKLHQTVLRRVYKDIFVGVGFYYDQFWNIKVIDPQTRRINVYIQRELGTTNTASGPVGKLIYDSRKNQINPTQGLYANVTLRQCLKELGSNREWASLQIDARKYFNFPRGSHNTLALWSFNWLTVAGTPNYLFLPSTGWDDQYNTGRGFVQSRFRGKQMIYAEAEYRYRITRNGLLGGVAFFNWQKYYGNEKSYEPFLRGYGAGLRIRINKKSGANVCLDYAFGNNSQGFFLNLGELF